MSVRSKTAGIYMLSFDGGHCYIGSSKEIEKRFAAHKNFLNNGTHANELLQSAYNEFGPPEYKILLVCRIEDLIFFEQRCLDNFHPNCNISRIAGRIEHNEKTRAKMSRVLMGRVHSQETREKIRSTLKGRRPPDSLYEAQRVAAAKRREGKPPKRVVDKRGSPEFRERMRQIAIEKFKDPEKRAQMSAVMKAQRNDPAYKNHIRNLMLEKFKDPDYKAKILAAQKAGRAKKAEAAKLIVSVSSHSTS